MAYDQGVNWMIQCYRDGRGPGNTKTEELLIELISENELNNLLPLFRLVYNRFNKLKNKYQWGTNPYYYLAGKYGIHPTFVQEIISDSRYNQADKLTTIKYLKVNPNKSFNLIFLEMKFLQ